MVVAGAMRGWDHDANEHASVAPRPEITDRSYERGHATGVGMIWYADVVVAWSMCDWVHDATERLSVEARPGRPSGGRRARVGSTTPDTRRRLMETRCGTARLDVRRRSMEARCGWLGPTRRVL